MTKILKDIALDQLATGAQTGTVSEPSRLLKITPDQAVSFPPAGSGSVPGISLSVSSQALFTLT